MWANLIQFWCNVGLPVQVRDQALKMKDEMPKSDVNKEYYIQNQERTVSTIISLWLLQSMVITIGMAFLKLSKLDKPTTALR